EAEARRAEHALQPDAMDLVFQGAACANRGMTPENTSRAIDFFERALVLDPQNTEALIGVAGINANSGSAFMRDDRTARLAAAEADALTALSKAPQHALAHLYLG